MTEVFSSSLNKVVATGDAYIKDGQLLTVPNCLPLTGPQVKGRYLLRDGNRAQISVECLTQGQPGLQTATFKEV